MRVAILSCALLIGLATGQYTHPSQGHDFTLTSTVCPPCECTTVTPTTTRTTTTTRATTTTTTRAPSTTTKCPTQPTSPHRKCPECVMVRCTPNACNQGALVPFPGDCTKFCKCELEGAWEVNCPAGLHFNEVLMVCDWPRDAACTIPGTYLPNC